VECGTQALFHEHEDTIPFEALFGGGRDPQADVEYRRLPAVADVVFGIDVMRGKQSILFGGVSLEDLVRTGQSKILGIVNVGLGQETMGIERLATLVQDIKGHHDDCVAGNTWPGPQLMPPSRRFSVIEVVASADEDCHGYAS